MVRSITHVPLVPQPVSLHSSTLLPSVTLSVLPSFPPLQPSAPCCPWWHFPAPHSPLSSLCPFLFQIHSLLQLMHQRHSVLEAGNWLFCSGPMFVLLVLSDSLILVPVLAATESLGSLMSPICIDVWGWALLRLKVALGAVCMSEVLQRRHHAWSWG